MTDANPLPNASGDHVGDPETPPPAPDPAPDPAGSHERSVLDESAAEDRDEAWGDRASDALRDDEWYRRERPPHHGD